MAKFNIDVDKVERVAKCACNVLVTAGVVNLFTGLFNRPKVTVTEMKRYINENTYSGVIDVIVNSNMLDSSKKELIHLLPKDANADIYESIATVVNSDMLDSTKIKMVKTICNHE